MNNQELLEQALHSGAIIHQPHALKAYLSANYLTERLGNGEAIFIQTSMLMKNDSIHVFPEYVESVQAPQLPEFRIHRILQRAIYPASYQATFQWYQSKGFQDIFEHFANKASLNNEYLSHNITILLAMNSVYLELRSDQVPTFLNRFTEFVTSTFSDVNEFVVKKEKLAVTAVLESCLEQFGFFGHNLITLVWLLRCKEQLSTTQYESMLSNLYLQANSPLEDPDDNIDLSIWEQCESQQDRKMFVQQVNRLIFDYSSNLHQITLADALLFLESKFPSKVEELTKIAQYQCLILEK